MIASFALVFVDAVDFIAAAALVGVIAVGLGFLVLPALYLLEWTQGKVRVRPLSSPRADADLPPVLVQMPVYNEPREVVAGLLQSVASLDWPQDRLHLQLLDDSQVLLRAPNQALVSRLGEQGFHADHLARDHRSGYKAGALAAGLRQSDAPFVAILDADFRPPSNWLKTAIPALMAEPSAGFIQSRCEFFNADTNWLTRAQSLLFDCHFIMEQGVRARAGMLFQFNGTGGIWRRRAIEEAGGWTADSLCEDLDLTIRAALAGWRGLFSLYPAVPGLVPDQMRHWRVQQRRWATGFAQIARTLTGPIWRSDWSVAEKLQAGFLIFYQSALPVIALAAVAMLLDTALHAGMPPLLEPLLVTILVLFLPVVVGMTLPPYIELRRGGVLRYLGAVGALPPLILYLSLTNARPIIAAFFGRSEVFKRTPKPVAELQPKPVVELRVPPR